MKTLIVFYSRTNTTKIVADAISNKIDCDMERIIAKKYDSGIIGFLSAGFDSLMKTKSGIEPIKNDPEKYDLIIAGTPVWANNPSDPIRTYFSNYHKLMHHPHPSVMQHPLLS